jgi:hypothetical protein
MNPVWFAEIEPFPSAVLAYHYPKVKNHGDMTKLAALVLAGKIKAPPVLVGGTPCQAFSVAGMRQGLLEQRHASNEWKESVRSCLVQDADPKWHEWLTRDACEWLKRDRGDTAQLSHGEYHRINSVSDGGVWTLFITSRWQGDWGFLVKGKKIDWRIYTGEDQ